MNQRHLHAVPTPTVWMRPGDVAEYLKVSVATVRRWTRDGILVSHSAYQGGGRFYAADEVDEALRSRKV
jgi:excisionase family DNA binding protein